MGPTKGICYGLKNSREALMKKLLSALLITLCTHLIPTQALAWWPMTAHIQVTPYVVQGTLYNSLSHLIYCEGRVYGQLQTRQWIYAWVRNWIAPGSYQYAYVYANAPFYFINGYSEIYCRY
jgi:hypothetical protein